MRPSPRRLVVRENERIGEHIDARQRPADDQQTQIGMVDPSQMRLFNPPGQNRPVKAS